MGVEGVIRRPKVNLKPGKGRSGGDQSTQRSTARSEEDVDSSDEPESNDDEAEDDDDEEEDDDEGNSGRQVPPQHSKSKDRDSTRIGTFLLCPTTITQVLLKSPEEESSSIPGNENELEEGPVWWEDELLSLSFNLSSFKFSESKDRFEDQDDWEDAKLREAINWYIEPWGLTYDSKEDIQTPQAKVFLENLKNAFGEGKENGCGYPKVRVSLEEPVGEIGGYVKVKTGEYPGLLDGYRWLSDVRGWPMEKGVQQKEKFIELMETVVEVTCDV
ncbi:hypothetical protein C8Q75DRAFT_785532 [Abortiporus biennis]|nr:hypothetical protein C8Q75DRAFT_785532 [Abortiporus biennis]